MGPENFTSDFPDKNPERRTIKDALARADAIIAEDARKLRHEAERRQQGWRTAEAEHGIPDDETNK